MTSRAPHRGPRAETFAEDLALRMQRGEPTAVEEVRSRVRATLKHRALGLSREEREDLEQEILAQLWQAVNRAGFDRSSGFLGFVQTVVARRCIDRLRARRDTSELAAEMPASTPDPLRRSLANEKRRLATETLIQLDAECRELIYLYTGLGKTYREISRLLGRSEGALRVQMHRCVKAARSALDRVRRSSLPVQTGQTWQGES